MTKRVWNSGPPPHVGWWNAKVIKSSSEHYWSWWDGIGWSIFASSSDGPVTAARQAEAHGAIYCGPGIEWTHYWPENARVPRINPETGEKTGG